MIIYLAMLGVGIASAFLPITPVEPYLIGVVATTSAAPVALGIAAGVGQALGKVLMFLAARGAIRSAFLRRKLARHTDPATDSVTQPSARRRRMARWVDTLSQPRYTLPVLSASSVIGFPPLLAVTVYLARTPMSPALFGAACLVGRSLRFVTLALAPHLITQ